MLTILAVVFLVWLVFGYFGYGRWIAKQFVLDDRRPTPAHELSDGEDYLMREQLTWMEKLGLEDEYSIKLAKYVSSL